MPKIRNVTWSTFAYGVENIAKLIKNSGTKYDYIYGIPRGGLVPAVMLSHILNIRLTVNLAWDSMVENYKVLIIDDIADSGKTIEKFINIFDIATVYCKVGLSQKPKYYIELVEPDEWIKFPYEVAVNDPISDINMCDRVKENI